MGWGKMMSRLAYAWSHKTKILGFLQITVGAIASVDGVFEPMTVKVLLMSSGVLTAWCGFLNSKR